jgi:membrane-bound serine protease (ClpP class)
MLVGGALLIYLEFNTPGTIVPGALGTLMVLLAIFGLILLPIRYTAVLLLVAALGLLCSKPRSADTARWPSPESSALPSACSRLWPRPCRNCKSAVDCHRRQRRLRRHHGALLRLAVRARRMKSRLGADALVGSSAKAMEPLSPEGHVLSRGRDLARRRQEPVATGAALRVVGHDAYLLRVEPVAGFTRRIAHG